MTYPTHNSEQRPAVFNAPGAATSDPVQGSVADYSVPAPNDWRNNLTGDQVWCDGCARVCRDNGGRLVGCVCEWVWCVTCRHTVPTSHPFHGQAYPDHWTAA